MTRKKSRGGDFDDVETNCCPIIFNQRSSLSLVQTHLLEAFLPFVLFSGPCFDCEKWDLLDCGLGVGVPFRHSPS